MLYAYSGGVCAKCRGSLFEIAGRARVTIADIAHVVAAIEGGPRGVAPLTDQQRSEFDNLILLCPGCHRLVDGAPEQFPVVQLLAWRNRLRSEVAHSVELPVHSRAELRERIAPLLRANAATFGLYGPDARSDVDPGGEGARLWQRKVRDVLLPNNMLIERILEQNRHLLNPKEQTTLNEFSCHIDDLAARHLRGVVEAGSLPYPASMQDMLAEASPA